MAITGSCHCKATRFEVDVAPDSVTSCTCSICSKKGALWAYYKRDDVRVVSKHEQRTYTWQSHTVKHNFCGVCGCATYVESPDFSTGAPNFDNPMMNINARLLDDFDLAAVPVTIIDGKNLW